MKIGIDPKAKEELGGDTEYRRLLALLFWLEEKLEIPTQAKLSIAIVHDDTDTRIGAVTATGSTNLSMMLNTSYFKEDNLNMVTGRYEDWFTTAAHEMVHVKQWATSQLVFSGVFFWGSRAYHADTSKLSYQEYLDLPWENEAFSKQDALYQEWKSLGEPNGV
jgi:hypothetical protein